MQCIEYEETDDPEELVDINSPSCETVRVPEEVKSSLYDLKCAIQLNRATCYQRLNENKLAFEMCEDVLKISPKHVKALYKRWVPMKYCCFSFEGYVQRKIL